jgi:hypothetical protein
MTHYPRINLRYSSFTATFESTMSFNLTQLPVELAGRIFEFASTTPATYRALSLVSRKTRTIVLVYAIPCRAVNFTSLKTTVSFRNFLTSHPGVAQRVQDLRFLFYFSTWGISKMVATAALQYILQSCVNLVSLTTSTRILKHALNKLSTFGLRKIQTLNLTCDDVSSTSATNRHPHSQALLSQITRLVTPYCNWPLFETLAPRRGAAWSFSNLTHFACEARNLQAKRPWLQYLHDEIVFPVLEQVVFEMSMGLMDLDIVVRPDLGTVRHAARYQLLTQAKEWDKLYLIFCDNPKVPAMDFWLEKGDLIWEEAQRLVDYGDLGGEAVVEFLEYPDFDVSFLSLDGCSTVQMLQVSADNDG